MRIYLGTLAKRLRLQDLAIKENHARACGYIRDAASKGAELVVLPEYVVCHHPHPIKTDSI